MTWAPEPKPNRMNSGSRWGIRRTAHGYALYDVALGELVSRHYTLRAAVKQAHRMRHDQLMGAKLLKHET